MNHQMLMASLILIPVIFGIILYKLPLKLGKFVLLGVQGYLLVLAVFLFLQTDNNYELYGILGGDSPILNIVLRGERLTFLLVVVTNFLFAIGFIYKITDKFFDGKIMLLYLILQGLTSGIFLTDDFFNLFILFEVSTVITTILLMFKKDGRVVYDALYYLITQMISMMFFLFGIGFLYRMFGILSISGIASMIPYVPDDQIIELILPFSFMMTGLCFKLAIFPMYSWISRAYSLNSAPITQVAVMSSIMMKTSLYWLFRFHALFLPAFDFSTFFIIVGVLTAIFSAVEAIFQKDIRLILAYSTVSQIGFITVAFFLGDDVSYIGSTYHMFNHAIFKMILFLSAGLIIRNYETADIYEIREKMKSNPWVVIVSIVGMLAITGFPLTSGSISKYFMSAGLEYVWHEILFWAMNFGTILIFVRYATMFLPGKKEKFKIKNVKKFALSILVIVSIIGGFSLSYGVSYLLRDNLEINTVAFLTKGLIYIGVVIAAVVIYKVFIYKKKYWDDRWENSLPFSKMCLVFMAFFTALIVYGLWIVRG